MMSLPVWLPCPMFLPGGLCLWSHVPSRGVSVSGSMFLPGGSLSGVLLAPTQRLPQRPPGQRPPWTETPQYRNTPMGGDTPMDRDPPFKRPLLDRPPGQRHPPGLTPTPPLYCRERILLEYILVLHLVPHARIIYISKI